MKGRKGADTFVSDLTFRQYLSPVAMSTWEEREKGGGRVQVQPQMYLGCVWVNMHAMKTNMNRPADLASGLHMQPGSTLQLQLRAVSYSSPTTREIPCTHLVVVPRTYQAWVAIHLLYVSLSLQIHSRTQFGSNCSHCCACITSELKSPGKSV